MNKFIKHLIKLGYIGNGCTSLQFSSVTVAGCRVIYTKDNSRFIFGLNEKGNPPTLIFPRKYKTKDNFIYEYSDAEMSGYLLKNEPEYIYNELLSDSIK